ncbi:MAG: hypothetical protein RL693_1063 [Verrucomicrobiota bacterium]
MRNMKFKNMPLALQFRHINRTRRVSLLVTVAASTLLLAHAPLKASETDDRIESAAQKSYVFKIFLKDDIVKTESKEGAVTLTGTVSEDSHKMLAQEPVSGLPGVKSVDNQIKVKESPTEQSDTWLYLKVKSALAFHRSVSAYHTQVEVNQGVATLKGEAANEAQKELVTEYAKDVEGIKEVKNEMTVAAKTEQPAATIAEIIDDASITAQVRMALMTHRSTSAFKTSVTTADGVVTVGGKASNAAEQELVSKLVNDINGVKSVVNHMIIETTPSSK